MRRLFIFAILVLFILLTTSTYAKTGHIYLLSAEVSDNITIGNVADLNLEIKPGKGRVFFESYPLSQVDTQISTRFAKQFACNFLKTDCSKLDFFYTISSSGPMIGGPSAGAGITVLTIAMLDNQDVAQDVVMTGTINSAGMVGPVGAVDAKIEGAKRNGFTKVVIPKFVVLKHEKENFSLRLNSTNTQEEDFDIIEPYLVDIEIIKVSDIIEALYHFTGKNYSIKQELIIPSAYSETMEMFSEILCNRTEELQSQINLDLLSLNFTEKYLELDSLAISLQDNFSNKTYEEYSYLKKVLQSYTQYNSSRNALENDKTYSAASFCFATNTILQELKLINLSDNEFNLILLDIEKEINLLKQKTNSQTIDSMIKLQTKQIVLERIMEAEEYLNYAKKDRDSVDLAYSIERLYSAKIWSEFFKVDSTKKEKINQELLDSLCKTKIMESRERIAYLITILSSDFTELSNDLDKANDYFNNDNSELCIFVASQVKARADLIITTTYLYKTNMTEFITIKKEIIKSSIIKQMEDDVFPIAALSYLQYAESLENIDVSSSSLYLEYASELGNLGMYFPKENTFTYLNYYFEDPAIISLIMFFSLFFTGITLTGISLVSFIKKRKK